MIVTKYLLGLNCERIQQTKIKNWSISEWHSCGFELGTS